MSKTRKPYYAIIISLVLVFILIAGMPLDRLTGLSRVFGAEKPKGYISELKLFRAYDEEDAVKKAEKAGFTPIKGDLNKGTGKDAIVMGYKETKDREKAVTDVRMMQMSSGFSKVTYKEIVEKEYPKLNSAISEEYQAIQEMTSKYSSGNPNAGLAVEYLNLFHIPEKKMGLGDYFVSGNVDKDMLKKLTLQTAMGVSTAIYQNLTLGVSDGSRDNWASKIKTIPVKEEMEAAESFAELDKKYLTDAERIAKALQDFTTRYENAKARYKGKDSSDPDAAGDAPYILAYDLLNEYEYEEDLPLGEFLVAMGSEKLSKKTELRELYPLVASMSKGQITTACMTGIHTAAIFTNDLTKEKAEVNKTLDKAESLAKECSGESSVSVWEGVDQDMFEQEVALTGDAQRYTNIQSSYENLSKRNTAIEGLEAFMEYAGIAASLVGGACALISIPGTIVSGMSATAAAAWAAANPAGAQLVAVLGKIASFGGALCTAVLVATLIILLIVWIYENVKTEADDLEYTEIPKMVIALSEENKSEGKNGMLRYDLISPDDDMADLNAGSGKQWNALYVSYNEDAGDPIPVYEGQDPFIVGYGSSQAPDNYKVIRNFDEISAANMNSNAKKDEVHGIYVFYNKELGDPAGDSDKEESKPEGNVKYISAVKINSADNETEAKNKLKNEGYEVVDSNLAASIYKVGFFGQKKNAQYSYIGYKTTKNADRAVTDIRMAKVKSKTEQVQYGNIAYAAAGYDPIGNSICYTTSKDAGSPILADIQVVDSIDKAKEGSVPVSYFGGSPYNYCANGNSSKWDTRNFVCFTPSVKVKSDEEYVSGIFFVTGRNTKEEKYDLDQYIKDLGGKKFSNIDLNKGLSFNYHYVGVNQAATISLENIKNYICYTTTNDPKRAIYDAALYIGTQRYTTNQPYITAKTGTDESDTSVTGYAVASVYVQNHNLLQSENTKESYPAEDLVRYEASQNFYNDIVVNEEPEGRWYSRNAENVLPGVKWKKAHQQPRAFYTCGYKEGYKPIKVSDIKVNGNGKAPEGFVSIQDFKYPYETKPINLAYYNAGKADSCNKVYFYMKREEKKKPTYISSLSLCAYRADDNADKETKKAIGNAADDTCLTAVLSGSNGGVLNMNLGVKQEDAWFNTADGDGKAKTDIASNAAFLGVSRTNDPKKAIHGIMRYIPEKGKTAPTDIKVGGVGYTLVKNLAGAKTPIMSANGEQYYLYQSHSMGASPLSAPITEITLDETPIISGAGTVLTVNNGDKEEETDRYGEVIKAGEETRAYGDKEQDLFLHVKGNDQLTGIDGFYVGEGKNDKQAQIDLLTRGAVMYLPMNTNMHGDGKVVYIGYSKYDPENVNTRSTKYEMQHAVKDLVTWETENPTRTIEHQGRKYILCGDVNLNAGTDGTPVYLYQTTEKLTGNSITDKQAETAYITKVAGARMERVPKSAKDYEWEHLVDIDGKNQNLNDGNFAYTNQGREIVDSRLFMFVHRANNYVKPEAVITGGNCNESTKLGDIVMKK